MAFLALSLIKEAQSVSVVSSGYRASLHSPVGLEVQTHTCSYTYRNKLADISPEVCGCVFLFCSVWCLLV